MRQQAGNWAPEDDWTGVTDQKERRKLQNRLNQRAYRTYIALMHHSIVSIDLSY